MKGHMGVLLAAAGMLLAGCGGGTLSTTSGTPAASSTRPASSDCWTTDGTSYVELFPDRCAEWDRLSSGPNAYWRPSNPPRKGERICSLTKGEEVAIVEAEHPIVQTGPESVCGQLVSRGWAIAPNSTPTSTGPSPEELKAKREGERREEEELREKRRREALEKPKHEAEEAKKLREESLESEGKGP